MKRSIRKLAVHGETVRSLRVMENKDLARVVGGTASADACRAPLVESGNVYCPAQAVVTKPSGG